MAQSCMILYVLGSEVGINLDATPKTNVQPMTQQFLGRKKKFSFVFCSSNFTLTYFIPLAGDFRE